MTDYDSQNASLINHERTKLEKNKAKAEAFKENMQKTISNLLKQYSVKRSLAKEAMAATDDRSRNLDLFKKAASGVYSSKDDADIITGLEPRPWED